MDLFTLNKSTNQLKHWVSEKRGTCKERITTNFEMVITKRNDFTEILESHTHGPDKARIDMLRGYNNMKERAAQDTDQSTRSIYACGVETMSESSLVQLPNADSIKRTIRLHRSGNEGSVNPASASGIEILEIFKVTSKGEPFLLYDSGFGDINRLILFATSKMLSILKSSHNWFADGTFKVAPPQFYQLYTIHAEKDGYVFPCVYSLLTKKDELTYRKIMRKLVELEPELDPSYIMVDFEKAAINAFEYQFLAVLTGCFFHFSQNVYRKIQSFGLASLYMEDQDFPLRMRMLPSLAFVPEHDVIDCFMILMADFPQSAMEVAEYFEETYIGRRLPDQTRRLPPFPVRFWSMYTRVLNQIARTNNSVEGWHNAFQSGLSSPHPCFPKLLKHFQRTSNTRCKCC